MDYQITIRSIQHFLYCAHRWGLMEINQSWAENAFVTKANLLHKRVHNPAANYALRGKKVLTGVSVYCDIPDYGIYGVTDCIELTPDKNGVKVYKNTNEKYSLCIVEYKPRAPKMDAFHEDDLMQVFAQKVCVDYIFHTDCNAVIYYAEQKQRVVLPIKENYDFYAHSLKSTLKEMRGFLSRAEIPQITGKEKCGGCSMKDMCMPTGKKTKYRSVEENVRTLKDLDE